MKRIALFALLLTLSVAQVGFAATKWEMDPAHSNIYFTVDHVFSKIRGHFNTFTADVAFDPEKLGESHFNFTIQVDSIDTNIEKRDTHLLSKDFFDAATYPQMIFTSKEIRSEGNGQYAVQGVLQAKGQEHALTLPLTFAGVTTHPMVKGKKVAGFNGNLVVDRLSLSVGDGKFYTMGIVGKDVDVLVSLELLADE